MTSWAEDRRTAGLELDHARQEAERVACPECEAKPGERCRNVHDGEPLGRLPAHWRRIKAALAVARQPSTPEQERWDQRWRDRYLRYVQGGKTHAEAIEIADRLTTQQHGLRPTNTKEET